MDDAVVLIIGLLILAGLLVLVVLPVLALVLSIRTRKKVNEAIGRLDPSTASSLTSTPKSLSDVIQQLTIRVASLEAAVGMPTLQPPKGPVERQPIQPPAPPTIATTPPVGPPARTPEGPPKVTGPPVIAQPSPARTIHAEQIESIIGRRWLGWVSIALILFATAFFLKYAFDNRWIGELGRVAIGVAAGITLVVLGFRYHWRQWRVFSQILTGGGVVLLYLSAYASFGYYHLATQKAAFVYMAILIAEAAGLALLYEAPAIAVVALIGGFLVPILLRSDRDQYRSLFSYIGGLDLGALALLKHWWGLSSIAFLGTHLLFWLWYADNYHPRKLAAVIVFQTAIFLIFLLAYLARRLFRREPTIFEDVGSLFKGPFSLFVAFEDVLLLTVNPFVFFPTIYYFLNPNHHDWMGVLAIGMAVVYAGAAKVLLDRSATARTELLLMIGVALTFVTIAVPIQLKSNWITIAWAVEALVMLWAAFKIGSGRLIVMAHAVFILALTKLIVFDTPYGYRPMFTPVLNKYFLSSLFVTICLFGAALAYRKLGDPKRLSSSIPSLILLIIAVITLWFVMTVENQTFFAARAAARKLAEDARHESWLGQMSLSVLWSIYAAVLMAVGFLRRSAALRWGALSLFALTVIKVMLVDISVLKQLYRIIAFLVLGVLLLVVAWGYHKAFRMKESSS